MVAGLAATALGGARALPAQAAAPDSGLQRVIHDYIALYRADSLERWRTLFLPSFTVAFTNADSSTTERTLEQFVDRQRQGFAKSPDMHEVLEHVKIEQRESLASAWAEFVFTADGQSRRGTLVMQLIRDRGEWKIQSLLFSYHRGG
jgi:SnoaL-like domain